MAPVVVVWLVWLMAVAGSGLLLVVFALRMSIPAALRRGLKRGGDAVDGAIPAVGRTSVAVVLLLASWAIIIVIGWLLGLGAHRLQGAVDEPTFRWWRDHYLSGAWHDVWWRLTDIGSPHVTQGLTVAAAAVFALVYRKRTLWWGPSVTMLLGYLAEMYSQIILKSVVDRGHPPTSLGTWPSGGMARLIVVYGLIGFFLIGAYWPRRRRAWATGAAVLALCASVQAYARINNLEHWLTDVVGGAIFGILLLAAMISFASILARQPHRVVSSNEQRRAAARR